MIETISKEEIRERIIELNHYLLTAMMIDDKVSIEEIRDEINTLINGYLE